MNREEYLKLINEKGYVDGNSEVLLFMNESSYRAQKIVNEINNKFLSQNDNLQVWKLVN